MQNMDSDLLNGPYLVCIFCKLNWKQRTHYIVQVVGLIYYVNSSFNSKHYSIVSNTRYLQLWRQPANHSGINMAYISHENKRSELWIISLENS